MPDHAWQWQKVPGLIVRLSWIRHVDPNKHSRLWTDGDLMLAQCRRGWARIKPALVQRLVFDGDACGNIWSYEAGHWNIHMKVSMSAYPETQGAVQMSIYCWAGVLDGEPVLSQKWGSFSCLMWIGRTPDQHWHHTSPTSQLPTLYLNCGSTFFISWREPVRAVIS